jgi:hypothetical protein
VGDTLARDSDYAEAVVTQVWATVPREWAVRAELQNGRLITITAEEAGAWTIAKFGDKGQGG